MPETAKLVVVYIILSRQNLYPEYFQEKLPAVRIWKLLLEKSVDILKVLVRRCGSFVLKMRK